MAEYLIVVGVYQKYLRTDRLEKKKLTQATSNLFMMTPQSTDDQDDESTNESVRQINALKHSIDSRFRGLEKLINR